jgi:RNA polymerase sigma-70 factor (ECF subfamily)
VQKTGPDLSELTGVLPSGESSPEKQILARERAQQVTVALEVLSEKQRSIFVMRFVDEMELPEICQATGMQMSTVKTHLHRAVKAVRLKVGGRA